MLNSIPPRIVRGIVAAISCGRYTVAVRIARVYVHDTRKAHALVADIAREAFTR